jgi:hypothetical protein
MGRFVYSMNVSLDLRIEQVPGDNGAGEWLRIDEEFHREANARTRGLAAIVHGRVYYELMEEYQPRAREDAFLPDVLRFSPIPRSWGSAGRCSTTTGRSSSTCSSSGRSNRA